MTAPVRGGILAAIDQLAGQTPDVLVIDTPSLSSLAATADPDGWWWKLQAGAALQRRDAERLAWLVEMAERNGTPA